MHSHAQVLRFGKIENRVDARHIVGSCRARVVSPFAGILRDDCVKFALRQFLLILIGGGVRIAIRAQVSVDLAGAIAGYRGAEIESVPFQAHGHIRAWRQTGKPNVDIALPKVLDVRIGRSQCIGIIARIRNSRAGYRDILNC